MSQAWLILLFAAGLFCLVRGVVDLAQRRYAWGVAGLLAGCAILLTPLQSRAIKVDLPPVSPQ
jgi:hypothetical protein